MRAEPNQDAVKKTEKTPEKLIYRLDEVGRLTGVASKTIESWEKEFPFLHAGLDSRGQKIFRLRDIEIIRRVRTLLEEKSLTMAGVKRRIEDEFGMKSSAQVHPDRIKRVLLQVRDDLQEIAADLARPAKKF